MSDKARPKAGEVRTYVCLDANILIRLAGRMVTPSIKGCDPKDWEFLKEMITKGDVTLLVPTVVLMEFEKTVTNSGEDFYETSLKLKQKLKQLDDVWNEARDDIRDYLYEHIDEWQRTRPTKWRNEGQRIRKWIDDNTPPVEQITFTQAIWFQAKARLIEGRFPKRTDDKGSPRAREWLQDNDCAIIESLGGYFGRQTDGKQLFLCTENFEDFGFLRESTRRNVLDKRLQPGLPPTEIFLNLASLVKALKERQPVEPPQTDEEFEAVLKEKAKEEELASGVSRAGPGDIQRPNTPTPGQLCGQALQRMYNDYVRDFQEAHKQRNMNVAASVFQAMTPLLQDFIEQEAKYVQSDRRWESLLFLREEFKSFLQTMGNLNYDGFWNQGESLFASLLHLARRSARILTVP